MMIKTTPPRFGQKGFTLIEIVMVLVLLGILAAVAVPKYFDVQEEAEKKVAVTIANELQARLNGEFAQFLLEGNACKDFAGIAGKPHKALLMIQEFNKELYSSKIEMSDVSEGGSTVYLNIYVNGNLKPQEGNKLTYPDCVE